MEFVVDVVLILGVVAVFAGALYWIFIHDGVLDQRLHLLRRWLTTGLEVAAREREVRRGEEVEAVVTVSRPRGLGQVEVGLVCTEFYDYESTWTQDGSTHTSRETAEETAHEAWLTVEPGLGEQSFRFTVPPEAPFSYSGECLSFKREVVALGRRRRRLDAQARAELSVLAVSLKFRLQLDRDRYQPGDAVRGRILVLEGGGSRSLEGPPRVLRGDRGLSRGREQHLERTAARS